jgi:hypothetical protein
VVPTPMVRVDGRARDPHQLLALHHGLESSRRVDRDRSDRILKAAKVSGRDFELLLSNLPARRGPVLAMKFKSTSLVIGQVSLSCPPFPSSPGSRAMFMTIRRASSAVSILACIASTSVAPLYTLRRLPADPHEADHHDDDDPSESVPEPIRQEAKQD